MTVSAVKTAYDALGTLAAATKAVLATLVALGARPTFPVTVVVDADYNSVATSQATYDSSYTTANATYQTALAAQKVQEAVVTALMPQNQWITLTTLANWGAVATQYISWPIIKSTQPNGCNLYTINSVTTLPVLPYPSLV